MADPSKFEEQDYPKIIEAIQLARTSKASARVVIDFSDNGGVLAIQVESKKRFK